MKIRIIALAIICFVLVCCRNSYYSEADYQSAGKIDSHIHIRSDKGIFEELAREDNFVLINLGVDHGDSADISEQHHFARLSAERYPGTLFFGPTFLFDTAGWGTEEWSRRVISKLENDIPGAITVKIWKNIGMTVRDRSGRFIMVDDPGLTPVINFIKSKNLPITGHLGEPRNCWLPLAEMTVRGDSSYFARNPQYHMYLHPEYPTYEDQINARDNMLAKHPDLTFIGCHLASLEWNVDSLAKRLDRFPNMAVDMSARISHLQYQTMQDRNRVRDFCIKYQDRLLYGTDVGESGTSNPEGFRTRMRRTWTDDWKYFVTDEEMTSGSFNGTFRGLKLPKEVVDKIYRRNAIKWYNL